MDKLMIIDEEAAKVISEYTDHYHTGLISFDEARNKMIDALANYVYRSEVLPIIVETIVIKES